MTNTLERAGGTPPTWKDILFVCSFTHYFLIHTNPTAHLLQGISLLARPCDCSVSPRHRQGSSRSPLSETEYQCRRALIFCSNFPDFEAISHHSASTVFASRKIPYKPTFCSLLSALRIPFDSEALVVGFELEPISLDIGLDPLCSDDRGRAWKPV